MNRNISKVAVLGSGIMGSGIACHFANIGVEVLLLDIAPKELNEKEIKQGLSLSDKIVKNRIVTEMFNRCIKSKPSPIFSKKFTDRVTLGNFDDDFVKIKDYDWIIEVVVERLDIKKLIFEKVDKFRREGTIISSNTSGIPIKMMNEGRSDDFQKHFAVTHFFNPPRYLNLFEVVPGPNCNEEITEFLMNYGKKFLGKTSVLAKDTPAFIGNRIGVFGIQSILHEVDKGNYSIEEIDKLTGPVIGRPKSATFRTADVVGLDTMVHVAQGIYDNCKEDENREIFKLPDFVNNMISKNLLGSKTKKGFYKKVTGDDGKSEILSINLKTLEYKNQEKVKFETLEKAKKTKNKIDKYSVLISGDDKASNFYRSNFSKMFSYIQHRIPEIADHIYQIDDAVKTGFGWSDGPFEIWDYVGISKGVELMKSAGLNVADWIEDMISNGNDSFYKNQRGFIAYYDKSIKKYIQKPGQENYIYLKNLPSEKRIWSNEECSINDLGDGIINIEFKSKMNSINQNILQGLNKGIDLAEEKYYGVVIGNEGQHFSAGADISMIFLMAVEQEYEELNYAMKLFQDTVMRMRYSSIPVVAAPHGYTFGGACELCLHCDQVIAHAETYVGLVEVGVGLIPGGGGTKEMTLRASDQFRKNDVEVNLLQEYFLNIGMGKVSTSGHEGFDLNYFKKDKDQVIMNKKNQINFAKKTALNLHEAGYTKPIERTDIKVLGQQALGMFYVGADSMLAGGYISDHDKNIAKKIANVISGGNLSQQSFVSEQYLLELEREAFLSLCGERKTLERIQYMLKNGKPLRN
jgi:3-hydroxyacyl-CoA dehydrogenase